MTTLCAIAIVPESTSRQQAKRRHGQGIRGSSDECSSVNYPIPCQFPCFPPVSPAHPYLPSFPPILPWFSPLSPLKFKLKFPHMEPMKPRMFFTFIQCRQSYPKCAKLSVKLHLVQGIFPASAHLLHLSHGYYTQKMILSLDPFPPHRLEPVAVWYILAAWKDVP